jgi:ABC-type nickel/cobalt efflux system permease component RcnA
MGTIILSAIVAHTAWHWLTDRYATLRQYRFEWPAIDAVFLVNAMRVAMVVVAGVGAWWLVSVIRQSRLAVDTEASSEQST